jgi:hypothetical protein
MKLLGIFVAQLLLTLAEPAEPLVLWELLRISLTLGEAGLERLLRIRGVFGTFF